MSKISNINLSTYLASYINTPDVVTKDGKRFPLYAHTQGEEIDPNLPEDAEWAKACDSKYSSPTNIRRVWIGLGGIAVQLYRSYATTTNKLGATLIYKQYSLDKSLSLSYQNFLENTVFNKNIDMAYMAKSGVERVEIKGNPFNFIGTPWVLSNLEEIYIDIDLLLTRQLLDAFPTISSLGNIGTFRKAALGDKNLKAAVARTFGLDADRLSKSFPNLSRIEGVFGLSRMITGKALCCDADQTMRSIGGYNVGKCWKDTYNATFQSKQILSGTLYINNRETFKPLSVRTMYRFDAEVLQPFASELASRLRVEESKESTEKLDKLFGEQQENQAIANKFIEYIKQIESEKGLNTAKFCVTIATLRMTKDEKEALKSSVSGLDYVRYFSN